MTEPTTTGPTTTGPITTGPTTTGPITGEQHALIAGPYQAVVTEAGAALRELTHEGRPLVLAHGAGENAPAASGQLLAPWPNRLDRGRYAYGGATHRLDVSDPDHDCAIHGLVRWAPWRAVLREPDRVRLRHRLLGTAGYPFRLDLDVEYALSEERGLTVRLTASNRGDATAPYGHGAHPYLTVGVPIDACTVTFLADRYLPVGPRKLPSGPPLDVTGTDRDLRTGPLLGDRLIDNTFTGLARDGDGRSTVTLAGAGRAVALWSDEAHPWTQIYTAEEAAEPRAGLAVEPMTCPPNAFVSGEDVIELAPGAVFTGTWGIHAVAP
ncbi:aldose 1-epimerase family protein [Actinomadura sp. NEAU-AAG7]|uniref:aldose 1-epimerase family protein n=1 Tax=Actinomadura sp. NEAU-AAG7 TaxID=2839640 RepID=UPI001BE449DC|nr:aldose 1-epimerase family protein [Actinomadura sp. NEAU-AAG7]MBT2209772.1 aldose 1-epimerase family protein [Actinomadura sp. NEAU-AAG7]